MTSQHWSGSGLAGTRWIAITWTHDDLGYSWWRHLMETFYALLALCAGNSSVTNEFSHKGLWRGALMFSFIRPWMKGWVNNDEAGDMRLHGAHYDVIVIWRIHRSLGFTLRPRQNGRLFPCDMFKRNFLNKNVELLNKISLKFVLRFYINSNPALVQRMALRHLGDKPSSTANVGLTCWPIYASLGHNELTHKFIHQSPFYSISTLSLSP